jgi:RHS repeat-associated protein
VKNLKFLGADGQILTAGKSGKVPPGQINGTGGGNNVTEAFRYFYHPDHLGSTSYITDASGEVYQHLEYFAFGETFVEEHSNTNRTPYLFNGKELDEETGLYYYGARYQDPRTSLFLSVDRFSEKYPHLTPYQYAANNPLSYVDINGDSIISIQRLKNKIIIENSPLKEGGENFNNTIVLDNGVSHDDISDYSVGIVNDAMIAIGDTEIGISSGSRTPEQQAAIMYHNLETGSVQGEKDTYGPAGDRVIDVYVRAKNEKKTIFTACDAMTTVPANGPKEIKQKMLEQIMKEGPGNVSNHTVNDPRALNVFDIRPSTVSDPQKMHSILIGDSRVKQVWSPVNKKSEKAIHVEINQPKK